VTAVAAPPVPTEAAPAAPPDRPRRRPRELTALDYATMGGCALSSIALNWLIFTRLTDGVGWFGFLVVAYLTFLGLFFVVTADRLGRLVATDRLASVAITSGAVVLAAPLLWLVGYIVVKGLPNLRLDFFTDDQQGITPTQPATEGGGSHALVGTLEQVGLALLMTLPLALATAVFLNETRSRLRRPVRIFVDAMSGLPSIVAGLFIFAVLILPYAGDKGPFGLDVFGFNGFMASLALALVMLPTITRTIEVVLRLVPDGLREASLATGASRARTVWSVVLPTARSGMATAIILGIARAVGETAPLLFTAFGYDLLNGDPFSRPQESLPLYVYRFIRLPNATARARGFTGALVLILVVLTLFAIARIVGRDRTAARGRRRRRTARATGTALEPQEPLFS
jgi:phosphate transport system permease protein